MGEVGVAQSQLMAQIAANPRIERRDTAGRYADDLLDDAIRLPYPEFEAHARRWESLADPIGQAEKSERLHAAGRAHLVRKPGGGWTLTAHFDDIGGEEFNNVFDHYTAAETEHDLAEAVEERATTPRDARHCDEPNPASSRRLAQHGCGGRRVPARRCAAGAGAQLPGRRSKPSRPRSTTMTDRAIEIPRRHLSHQHRPCPRPLRGRSSWSTGPRSDEPSSTTSA